MRKTFLMILGFVFIIFSVFSLATLFDTSTFTDTFDYSSSSDPNFYLKYANLTEGASSSFEVVTLNSNNFTRINNTASGRSVSVLTLNTSIGRFVNGRLKIKISNISSASSFSFAGIFFREDANKTVYFVSLDRSSGSGAALNVRDNMSAVESFGYGANPHRMDGATSLGSSSIINKDYNTIVIIAFNNSMKVVLNDTLVWSVSTSVTNGSTNGTVSLAVQASDLPNSALFDDLIIEDEISPLLSDIAANKTGVPITNFTIISTDLHTNTSLCLFQYASTNYTMTRISGTDKFTYTLNPVPNETNSYQFFCNSTGAANQWSNTTASAIFSNTVATSPRIISNSTFISNNNIFDIFDDWVNITLDGCASWSSNWCNASLQINLTANNYRNLSMTKDLTNDVFYYKFVGGLPAGIYNLTFITNNSFGNSNISGTWFETVSKNTSTTVTLTVNDTNTNSYRTLLRIWSNASAYVDKVSSEIWINTTSNVFVLINSSNVNITHDIELFAGVHNITFNYTGGQNYTSKFAYTTVVVTRAWNQTDGIVSNLSYNFSENYTIFNATPIVKFEQARIECTTVHRVSIRVHSCVPINVTHNTSNHMINDTTNFTNVFVNLSVVPSGLTINVTSWNVSRINYTGIEKSNITNATMYGNLIKFATNYTLTFDKSLNVSFVANSSVNRQDYNYINFTIEVSNNDTITYNNVSWNVSDWISGIDTSWQPTNHTGLILQINDSQELNVTGYFRYISPMTNETTPSCGPSCYEKRVDLFMPNSEDSLLYKNVSVNVTVSTSYNNYKFYEWDGAQWICLVGSTTQLETCKLDFTDASNSTSLFFKYSSANGISSWVAPTMSTHYYDVISTGTPSSPPVSSQPAAGGSQDILTIIKESCVLDFTPSARSFVAEPGTSKWGEFTVRNIGKANCEGEWVVKLKSKNGDTKWVSTDKRFLNIKVLEADKLNVTLSLPQSAEVTTYEFQVCGVLTNMAEGGGCADVTTGKDLLKILMTEPIGIATSILVAVLLSVVLLGILPK